MIVICSIRQQVRHLLWRLNDAGYRNEKHKAAAKKAKQDNVVVSDIPHGTSKKGENGHQQPNTSNGGPSDKQDSYAPQRFSVGSSFSSSIDLEREDAARLEEKTRSTTGEKPCPSQTRDHQQLPSSTVRIRTTTFFTRLTENVLTLRQIERPSRTWFGLCKSSEAASRRWAGS